MSARTSDQGALNAGTQGGRNLKIMNRSLSLMLINMLLVNLNLYSPSGKGKGNGKVGPVIIN
jgi:hypothetical protein